MSPAKLQKLKALALHPQTPTEEAKSARAILEKYGVSLQNPTKRVSTRTKSSVERRSTKTSDDLILRGKKERSRLTESEAKQFIKKWSARDSEWGVKAGYGDCGFQFIVKDSDGSNAWAFSEYEDAMRYARDMPKLRVGG